ncbi:UbiA family prenyltransferase [Candidatus Woesebacteria bacterium]|nr:UbiA family prenyltransferase [Candidatus Woesebacteria bacterium]
MKKVAAYAKLLRLPGIGALGTTTLIGALTVGVTDLVDLSIVFLVGSLSAVFGFLLNDYADVELDNLVDDLKKKPLVSGDVSKRSALMIGIFLILLTFFLISLLYYEKPLDTYKFIAINCIILAGILGSVYDLFGKRIIGSDFLVSISMSFVFLFGALSFGQPTVITWIIFILTFNQALHMNAVEGGIKDADHDYKMGVTNIALSSGVKVDGNALFIPPTFKAFGFGIRLCSAVLLFTPFVFFGYDYYLWQIILLAVLTFILLVLSVKFLTMKIFDRSKIRKLIGIQSFLRYSLVPIMLIPIIDILPSVILIFFPIVWYIVFTPLLGEELFKPRM